MVDNISNEKNVDYDYQYNTIAKIGGCDFFGARDHIFKTVIDTDHNPTWGL